MGTISFNNNGINPFLQNKLLLKQFLGSILEKERVDFKSVSYVFCTDEYLLRLNQQYLKHDTFTDIITFTLSSVPMISEIYISIERVRENAEKLQIKFANELYRVMIHGILHVCGYSDHTKALKLKMRKKEDYYLEKFKNVEMDK